MSIHDYVREEGTVPYSLVDCLIRKWHLNDAEAGDLTSYATDLWELGIRDHVFDGHMKARAEILARVGTDTQELYDLFERHGE